VKAPVGAGRTGECQQLLLELEDIGLDLVIKGQHITAVALAFLGPAGRRQEVVEGCDAREQIPEGCRGHGVPQQGDSTSGFHADFVPASLAVPAGELAADTIQQTGGVLITTLINQVEIVQEAGLNLE
jgi:hypothetical protein